MKQNYIPNMIMNESGTICQLIHYFTGKQGLAINLVNGHLEIPMCRTLTFWGTYLHRITLCVPIAKEY